MTRTKQQPRPKKLAKRGAKSASKGGSKSASKKAGAKKKTAAVAKSYSTYLIKSEPFVYSFDQLLADRRTSWDGVRNYEARNTMRAMKKGDALLFYHSNKGLEIVGVARVSKEAYQDPTTSDDWSSVEIEAVKKLTQPVSLATIKASAQLSEMALVKRSRISVTGVTELELAEILKLAKTTI